MKTKIFILFFCAIFCIFCFSCANEIIYSKNVPLPEWPPENSKNWPPLDSWKITVTSASSSKSFEVQVEKKSFLLEIPKEESFFPISIIAQPKTFKIDFFEPAGMIFPYEKNISWRSGFSSEILKKIYINLAISNSKETVENFVAKFNWEKFSESIKLKANTNKTFYNPWLLSEEEVLKSISAENFSASLLNLKKCKTFSYESFFNKNSENQAFHSYIPQNFSTNSDFVLSTQKINQFFLYNYSQNNYNQNNQSNFKENAEVGNIEKFEYSESKIISVYVNQDSTFLLAVNSLPL